ncbi:alpha/beta-hydrolase [Flagelloscypha sp. PMI_526]|nr:alpha/beta-hydrolase [Flagelloscypha sp. PMI_526]
MHLPYLSEGRAVTAFSAQEVDTLTPFIQFARATYCTEEGAQSLKDWKCGPACDANPTFQPAVAGGDGGDVQFFVAGFLPDTKQIVLAYQGTDPFEFESVLTDLDILPDSLDTGLFPGLAKEALVHGGFQDAFKASSDQIFPVINNLIQEKGTKDIVVTGHSLGGALAQLAAMHMALTIPDANIQLTTFGMPRVGNPAWASAVTDKVPNRTRVNNQDDLVPIIPPIAFGFAHPEGEVHLLNDDGTSAVSCSGVDSEDKDCTIDSVPNVLFGSVFDHLGPYKGIHIGLGACG